MLSISSSAALPYHLPQTCFEKQRPFRSLSLKKQTASSFICSRIAVEQIAEIAQNKVLVAAAVASAIGQLSKPFTSALYGKGLDFKAAIGSGGMPSTHSASIVAVATSLGLERGFSDSIFGMSVVLAGLIMYDAQGVRREVGIHAKVLNRELLKTQDKSAPREGEEEESLVSLLSVSKKMGSYTPNSTAPSSSVHRPATNLANKCTMLPSNLAAGGRDAWKEGHDSYLPLKESVGHTELQVVVGALLGFLVSLAVDTIL